MNINFLYIKRSVISLSLLVFAVSAAAFAETAVISSMEGDVNYVKAGTDMWQAAEPGTELSAGDKISFKE